MSSAAAHSALERAADDQKWEQQQVKGDHGDHGNVAIGGEWGIETRQRLPQATMRHDFDPGTSQLKTWNDVRQRYQRQ